MPDSSTSETTKSHVAYVNTEPRIAYLCDRGACGSSGCPSLLSEQTGGHDYCQHTTDIKHAVNFSRFDSDPDIWFEKSQ